MNSMREHLRRFKLPLVVNGMLFALAVFFSAWAWVQLPSDVRIAIHWNTSGTADGYAGKLQALSMMPACLLGISVLFFVLPFIEPRKQNLLNSSKAYNSIWILVSIIMTLSHTAVVANALGIPVKINSFIQVSLGLMLVVTGNYMSKVRSNFFWGIRTPWTLSSELSWNKTHRLGGRLFMLLGIAVTLTALFNAAFLGKLMTGGIVALMVIVVGYSYHVWKNDPNKQASGR